MERAAHNQAGVAALAVLKMVTVLKAARAVLKVLALKEIWLKAKT
jgi:hypothetical protein